MVDFIDEYFVKPMQFPDLYAPYNIYNTAVYAILALIAAYLIYKFLQSRKIAIDTHFYYAVLPFIFFGGIMRVIQDAGILPRSMDLGGITIYPFITPGIYIIIFLVLAGVYHVSRISSKGNHIGMLKKIRNAGIGLNLGLFSILALWGFSRINLNQLGLFVLILILTALAALIFEIVKSKFYNKREDPELKGLERTTVIAQSLDGSATFVGVTMGGYFEQHVLANAIFGTFGSPFAFYLIKILFVFALVFALRKESESKAEQVFVLLLITIFGLAPGLRDALRLLFMV